MSSRTEPRNWMPASREADDSARFDLLEAPLAGRFFRWRHARTALQIPLAIVSLVMIVHGFYGPALAPKNLATTLSWIHFRGLLVLVLLLAGNFFCMACPFMLVRQFARRFIHPALNWPQQLRNKWIPAGLLALILFSYELFGLWSSPYGTAWLIVGYFVLATAIDSIFKQATFCKFVCPIGQFNFVASLISPLEVTVRSQSTCGACESRDCIRGRRAPEPAPGTKAAAESLVVIQRGCELALFQPLKTGNMDCTFCLDCVQACPHDNVGILSRIPAEELMTDPRRSGIGFFSRRKDIAALIVVFTFGALLNAFGMITPVYALEHWMAQMLGVTQLAPVLAIIFAIFLIAAPVLLLGLAAWSMRMWVRSPLPAVPLAVRYSYALAPFGFGAWLAHYGFHFLTAVLTVIPVTQNAVYPALGEPLWRLTGLPKSFVPPLQMGFLVLGLAGSLLVVHRLAEQDSPHRIWRAFAPWAAVVLLLWLGAMWLMLQPMDMRGTFAVG
ncbi:MAG TPA: hypothetical protein VG273_01650 [Bryobacteraceae bacterium]|jgi:ferredoxin|nr:hypothetical protein [Bryobacteraceae bacterium]